MTGDDRKKKAAEIKRALMRNPEVLGRAVGAGIFGFLSARQGTEIKLHDDVLLQLHQISQTPGIIGGLAQGMLEGEMGRRMAEWGELLAKKKNEETASSSSAKKKKRQ